MVEKLVGKVTVEEAFDFSQPSEAQIEAAKDTKKTEFQGINNPLYAHALEFRPCM